MSRAPEEETELSDVETAIVDATADEQDAVLLFVGGPLDGRVEVRAARHGAPLPTVTHVHLHGGPKVVSRYDLQSLPGRAGVYHLRQREPRPRRGD
ncbi:hypothetical protein ACI8AA_11655 [Geodermatophilus sp. SYSU D01180]